jgi:hypothetical protein
MSRTGNHDRSLFPAGFGFGENPPSCRGRGWGDFSHMGMGLGRHSPLPSWNVSVIYGSYATIKMWWEQIIQHSRMYLCEVWIPWFDYTLSKLENTIQHFYKLPIDSLCRPLKPVLNLPNRMWATKHPKKHLQTFNRIHTNSWFKPQLGTNLSCRL